jgi:hypothetical protein
MLVARSAPECRLFIDLHPCMCGAPDAALRHSLRTGADGALIAVYSGTCELCGIPRLFQFELAPETPPLPPAFGGSAPSQIICPGQFALVADQESASARLQPEAATEDRARDRDAIARAVAAEEEIIKFVPPGADAVPPQAFSSPEGRALYARDPGRFDADRLRAVANSYRETLEGYDRSGTD